MPTSTHPGKFYALPQSPQTYKQLYVISGFERYYQIARCFRDEATRADRTAEFTQLDMELAFVEPDELHALIEGLFAAVWREVLGVELPLPFPRLTHDEAMLRYASDKPDTRFGCEIADVTDALRDTEFNAFRGVIDAGGVVRGFAVPGAMEFSRKDFDGLVDFARGWGGKGVAWMQVTARRRGALADRQVPVEDEVAAIVAGVGAEEGETILLVADEREAAVRVLGPLRLHLGERLGLIEEGWNFLWLTAFPMFEWIAEEKRWKAAHNPFSAPEPEFEADFESDPPAARARQYDLVLNGNEVGGGSIRNHKPEVQKRVFRMLGISEAGGRGEVLVPAARARDGRAAARRHRVRDRPAGDAARGRRIAARRHRVPEGPGRRRPAHGGADGGHREGAAPVRDPGGDGPAGTGYAVRAGAISVTRTTLSSCEHLKRRGEVEAVEASRKWPTAEPQAPASSAAGEPRLPRSPTTGGLAPSCHDGGGDGAVSGTVPLTNHRRLMRAGPSGRICEGDCPPVVGRQ